MVDMPFTREYRVIFAESILKKFDGKLTPQVRVSLEIAERRLVGEAEPLVNGVDWAVLQNTGSEAFTEANLTLTHGKFNAENADAYVADTLKKLTEKFPQTTMNG